MRLLQFAPQLWWTAAASCSQVAVGLHKSAVAALQLCIHLELLTVYAAPHQEDQEV